MTNNTYEKALTSNYLYKPLSLTEKIRLLELFYRSYRDQRKVYKPRCKGD